MDEAFSGFAVCFAERKTTGNTGCSAFICKNHPEWGWGNPELTVRVPVFSSEAMVGSPLGEYSFDGRTYWEPLEYRNFVPLPEDSNSTVTANVLWIPSGRGASGNNGGIEQRNSVGTSVKHRARDCW